MRLSLTFTTCLMINAACAGDPADTTSDGSETGDTDETTTTTAGSTGDGTTEEPTTGEVDPLLEGAPTPDTPAEQQIVDVFGDVGLRYWFVVRPDQLARMNEPK